MSPAPERSFPAISSAIALLTVLTLAPLLVWDASPGLFPDHARKALAAIPLALIAVACLVHPVVVRASAPEWAKAAILAAAFLFWAANQFWPEQPEATRFNDIAVALFVLDVCLAIRGWPSAGCGSVRDRKVAAAGDHRRMGCASCSSPGGVPGPAQHARPRRRTAAD